MILTRISPSGGHHTHTEKINLDVLQPEVTVTANGAAIPAANLSQAAASADTYDPATGVWTLPDGFKGTATLTLVADPAAVSSVKATIANGAEVCENDAGPALTTVDGRAAVDRLTCEFNSDGTTSSGNHWGDYQWCIKADGSAMGHDPAPSPCQRQGLLHHQLRHQHLVHHRGVRLASG